MMNIEADTIEHKSMSEFMENEFNGLRVNARYGKDRYRRMDILIALLLMTILLPTLSALLNYKVCLQSIRGIEKERMKEITMAKKRNFRKVLFDNPDFNKNV